MDCRSEAELRWQQVVTSCAHIDEAEVEQSRWTGSALSGAAALRWLHVRMCDGSFCQSAVLDLSPSRVHKVTPWRRIALDSGETELARRCSSCTIERDVTHPLFVSLCVFICVSLCPLVYWVRFLSASRTTPALDSTWLKQHNVDNDFGPDANSNIGG